MRTGRIKLPNKDTEAYYHCVSRVVDRQFIFGDEEKEMFVQMMRKYERFYGVRVMTFCVMSNHFHILVQVPRQPEVMPSDEELLECRTMRQTQSKEIGLRFWHSPVFLPVNQPENR